MSNFIAENQQKLDAYIHMSNMGGSRSDYVQGGGGNTSVKFDSRLMAIKASGFCLNQISANNAYAVLDFASIRKFYNETDATLLDDVEVAGSACAKDSIQVIDGLPQLRPSVEAGFHSLLDTYVLHTHPVYANLAACSVEGPAIVVAALAGLEHSHGFVPYINPGAQLTFTIGECVRSVEAETGKCPQIIFMQNHGLIVTGKEAEECLRLHDEVNQRIATAYGVSEADWPKIDVVVGESGSTWISSTPWLKEKLLSSVWDLDFFTKQSLYPDQLVFLAGQMEIVESGSLAHHLVLGTELSAKCTIFRETGEVYYTCGQSEALTIEQTLCAILFIIETINASGRTLCTMDDTGKDFISNWESEKYRRSMAAK